MTKTHFVTLSYDCDSSGEDLLVINDEIETGSLSKVFEANFLAAIIEPDMVSETQARIDTSVRWGLPPLTDDDRATLLEASRFGTRR